jgi:hypothetical protein
MLTHADVRVQLATAEKMYVTALQLEPDNIDALCNYALLLRDGLLTYADVC